MTVYVDNEYSKHLFRGIMRALVRDYPPAKVTDTTSGFKVEGLGIEFHCIMKNIELFKVKEVVNDEAQNKLDRIREILNE